MRYILALIVALTAIPAHALEMEVQRVYISNYGSAKAVVAVTNDDEPNGYKMIGVECAWLRNGKAVVTSGALITNLPIGETAYAEPGKPLNGQEIDGAKCRIDYAIPY